MSKIIKLHLNINRYDEQSNLVTFQSWVAQDWYYVYYVGTLLWKYDVILYA